MKRCFALLLVIIMLLAGCGKKEVEPTSPVPSSKPEVPSSSWYEEGSEPEDQTNGALLLHRVDGDPVERIAVVDDKILLICSSVPAKLTVLNAEDCVPIASMELESGAKGVQSLYHSIAYYASSTNEVVYMDMQLQELSRICLPEEISGMPICTPDGSEIYYCVEQEIKAFNTTENIARPVRNHTCMSQTLLGVYFNGEVIASRLEQENGAKETVYVSGKTGALLYRENGIYDLTTQKDRYVAFRMDGSVRQQIVGTLKGEPLNLQIDRSENVVSAVALNGIVSYYTDETETTYLSFYDLDTGIRTGALSVSGIGTIQEILTDVNNNCLWILSEESEDGSQNLCRWDHAKSAVTEEDSYLQPVFSKENLDEEGMSEAQDRADELSAKHGVDIRIGEDAVSNAGKYSLEEEYQTEAINRTLDELETVLEQYPENFLYKSVNRLLRICIVRSVSGEPTGVQYWDGTECYIVLSVGSDLQTEFAKAMGYAITNRALAKSPHLDGWTGLNPEGFVYNETMEDSYLEGENRAFADKESMVSVTDDRSILFAYAVGEDNDEVFASPIMQEKLVLLCKSIRDAWNWEKKTEVYRWEQYLKVPLAPEK